MKFSTSHGDVFSQKSDILFVFVSQGDGKTPPLTTTLKKLDGQFSQSLSTQMKTEKFKGADDELMVFFIKNQLSYNYVVVLGLGEKKKLTLNGFRKAGATIQSVANKYKAGKILVQTDDALIGKYTSSDVAQALAEGALLDAYQFTRYKKAKETSLEEVCFNTNKATQTASLQKGAEHAELLCEAVCLARDLVNGSGADVTPKVLADTATKLKDVKTKVHDLSQIKKMKMGAFLSVAKGSTVNPPCFIEMHYTPRGKARKKIALVGKGVTFDSGGYSLKPAKSMETMKDDMSGAAAVIGLMSIIARLKPEAEVSGYIAATENMIDGGAQRPGDVCTAMNGKTIEVLNTDAEGRLTLADALHYANRKKPDYMIDMATLTGACLVALGMLYSGVMGNDQKLIDKIIACGKHTGENFWHLPLPEEYKTQLKSDVADLKNIGGPHGGTLTAGLFLQDFVGDTKWAHIDIAGPAFTESPLPYTPKGGTGIMVRTLAKFIEDL